MLLSSRLNSCFVVGKILFLFLGILFFHLCLQFDLQSHLKQKFRGFSSVFSSVLTFHYQAVLWLPPWSCRESRTQCFNACWNFYQHNHLFFLLPPPTHFIGFLYIHASGGLAAVRPRPRCPPPHASSLFSREMLLLNPWLCGPFLSSLFLRSQILNSLYIFPLCRISRPRALFFYYLSEVYFGFESKCVVWIFFLLLKFYLYCYTF